MAACQVARLLGIAPDKTKHSCEWLQVMLPLEERSVAGIRQEYAGLISGAHEVLNLGLQLIGSTQDGRGYIRIQKNRGLDWRCIKAALGLYAKITKQYRSIILLCEHGLWKDGWTIERAMFEAVLALNFLLRPRQKISGLPITAQKWHSKGLKPLTTRVRKDLYVAAAAIGREAELNEYLKHGLKDMAGGLGNEEEIRSVATFARKRIGQGWSDRMKKGLLTRICG